MVDDGIFSFDDVWARIRHVTGWKRYSELADFLNIKGASVAGAKARGVMPIDWAFRVAWSRGVSTDWILTGKESNSSFDINLLIQVAQVFERIFEKRELLLDWKTKGRLLGRIFEEVRTLGFAFDDAEIEKITQRYLVLLDDGVTTVPD